ncbi:hypothetical protein HELRODRAFT_169271 [Helobdella robusta]|uniref:DUF4200 domain-containing protein n=1 Tax=Helobdella robusta TaxID=6412 RepID=T1F1P2_HELRO|nr:hypothetical protein HELRODRAFT_169271 [Helobdella robusta]ESO08429.1 hypothetical protein HELRODRAFT_169271 [Helobdella robusta]
MNNTRVTGTKAFLHTSRQKIKSSVSNKSKEAKFVRTKNLHTLHKKSHIKKAQDLSTADYRNLYQQEVSDHMTTKRALLHMQEINSNMIKESEKKEEYYLNLVKELTEQHESVLKEVIREKNKNIRDLQFDFYNSQIKVKSLKLQIKNIFTENSKSFLDNFIVHELYAVDSLGRVLKILNIASSIIQLHKESNCELKL